MRITFKVNGQEQTLEAGPLDRLLDLLRVELGLTGTKEGCGEGECGACTVLLDGEPVCSCLVPACQLEGAEVMTIEGLAPRPGEPDPLFHHFVADGGVQCGFCTPGMLVSARALLRRQPQPTDAEIRQAIAGNLCRCTGYTRILEAIRHAAEEQKAAAGADEETSHAS